LTLRGDSGDAPEGRIELNQRLFIDARRLARPGEPAWPG
jgi:hypothetical protein